MKVYFDNNLLIIPDKSQKSKIVYSPNSHSVIKINSYSYQILKKIINIGSGNEFDFAELKITNKNISKADLTDFISLLVKNKILFYTETQMQDNNIFNKIDKISKRINLKIAYVHLTQRCNLNCKYCYDKKNINKWSELNIQKWFTIIDKLKNAGIEKLVFTGGEPLLYKNIENIIDYAHKKRFYIELLSNGTLLDKNTVILKYINSAIISLDSLYASTNELTRRHSKNYSVLEQLKELPNEYKSKITIRSVITKENVDTISETRQYIKDLGFNYTNTIFLPNSKSEIELIPDIQKESLQDEPFYFNHTIINCGGCYKEIAINSNGDVYPCQNFIKDNFLITNILRDNWLKELEESQITKHFMNTDVRQKKKCNKCVLKFICGGGCKAITYNVYKNSNEYPDFLCDYFYNNGIDFLQSIRFKNENIIYK